jgi:FlaA1/EpsC-like NDP-sugar epimerase
MDIISINLSFFMAFIVRFEGTIMTDSLALQYIYTYLDILVYVTIIKLIVFYIFRMYSSLWRYASIEEMFQIILASIVATTATVSLIAALQMKMPRSIYLLTFLFDTILVGGVRFSYRLLRRGRNNNWFFNRDRKRIMIVGAGAAAAMLVKEFRENPKSNEHVVVLVDDDPDKLGFSIGRAKVAGKLNNIKQLVSKYRVEEIVIAIPSADKPTMKKIVEIANQTNCKLKTLPSVYDLVDGKITIQEIRDVNIEDLLGRDEIQLDQQELQGFLENKTILVTGGGGSIGSELCRQISKFNPERVYILDIYENNAYELELELSDRFPEIQYDVIIASVRDSVRITNLFKALKPQVIFHAAAHKHVPLMEANPREAIKNNIYGSCNVIKAAIESEAEKMVLISTDKAVNPTNVMGATKRYAEMLIQGFNQQTKTELVAVRFGNVLGSNGSVIPLFKRQIKQGGPITITHPDIIRYFMTIPEASQLVLQAGAMAEGGEIFVLDMGKPVKIVNLAENLIRLSGFEPYEDINIEFIGLRPGEKLFEELLIKDDSTSATKNNQIFVEKPVDIDLDKLTDCLSMNKDHVDTFTNDQIKAKLKEMVPTYIIDQQMGVDEV